jgi:hypothetical protein
MSSNIDLRAIWLQQNAIAKPDVNEVIKRSVQLKKKARNKLLWVNALLLATIIYYVWLFSFGYHTAMVTTRIGSALVILGFVAYLVVSNGLLLNLFKSHPEADSFAYLTELLTIRRKQEFVQTKVMTLYLLTLCVGMSLCMIEWVINLGFLWGGILYLCLFAWIAFIYFYLKPRTIKKQRAEWGTIIEKLQAINDQLLLIKNME